MSRETKRSQYFQAIARLFFDLRGAPFVLSSRDQVTIATWEEARIPLAVALEGIQRAVEKYRERNPGRKMPALSFCHREVMKAFGEHRERKVGRAGKVVSREEKRKRARAEVEAFCRRLPPEWTSLQPVLDEALRLLSRRSVGEEELERLEEELEAILLAHAPEKERAEAKQWVGAKFSSRPGPALEEAVSRRLIKSLRQKIRIPHFPLYYY